MKKKRPDFGKNRITGFPHPQLVKVPDDLDREEYPSGMVFGQSQKGELTGLPTQSCAYHVKTGAGNMMMQPVVIFRPRDLKGKRECIVKFLLNGNPAMGLPVQLRSAKLLQKWFGEIVKALETKKPEEG